MARIIYAAHGEGFGHAARAHSVGAGLIARGHDIRFISSLKGALYLQALYPELTHTIYGPSLVLENGRIRAWQTCMNICQGVIRHGQSAIRTVDRLLSAFEPDLVISDAESFVPLVAKSKRTPFISLDNQHVLTHCDIDVSSGYRRDFLKAYAAVRAYHLGARRYLISTFFDARIRYQPSTIVPPILRQAVYTMESTHEDYLVAYLGGLGTFDQMCNVLDSTRTMPIRAYGFEREGTNGLVTYKPPSVEGFLKDLAGCAGVIASAGHTLITECLYLEKPMLLVPFFGQFEQRLNAEHVRQIGAGDFVTSLSAADIDSFGERLNVYRQALVAMDKASLDVVLDAVEREIP